MKIIVAKYAGFCEGVRRAVGMALDLAQKSRKPLYTCGELIHNPQVISLLRRKSILDVKEIDEARDGSLLVRSHGIPPAQREKAQNAGIPVVDATCPHVLRIHSIIKKAAADGANTIIVGDAGHAEVEGLLGCAAGRGHVVGSVEEVDSLAHLEGPVCIVAQTTQDEKSFEKIAQHISRKYQQAHIHRTICSSTRLRQEEARTLASQADAVVVVGGKNSANTTRLAQIASHAGVPAYHVETPEELEGIDFSRFSTVAVTAGASTPNWIIRKVVTHLAHLDRGRLDRLFDPVRAFVRFLALSNIYVAAGAGAFTFAASVLLGVPLHWRYPVIALLSILSLHTVNQYLAAKEASYFYSYGRTGLAAGLRIASAAVSAIAAVALAATVGWLETLVVAIGLGLGSIYGMQVAPDFMRRITGFRSLRDIPASKDIFAAAGWTVLVAGLPAMSDWGAVPLVKFVLVSAFVFIMVYVRSTLLDVGEIERDRAVGREATPFVLGKRRTKMLVAALVLGSLTLIIGGYLSGIFSSLSLLLCVLPFYTAGYFFLYHQRLVNLEISLELLVDGKFLLAGALAWLWLAAG